MSRFGFLEIRIRAQSSINVVSLFCAAGHVRSQVGYASLQRGGVRACRLATRQRLGLCHYGSNTFNRSADSSSPVITPSRNRVAIFLNRKNTTEDHTHHVSIVARAKRQECGRCFLWSTYVLRTVGAIPRRDPCHPTVFCRGSKNPRFSPPLLSHVPVTCRLSSFLSTF